MSNDMSSTTAGESSAKETCGVPTENGTCGNHAGDDGTCWIDSHTPDKIPDGEGSDDGPTGDAPDNVRGAFGVIADKFADDLTAYKEKGENRHDPDDNAELAAVAFARKVADGNSWRAAFGACQVSDCQRGCTGFEAETCDEHDASDIGTDESADESGDTMTVTIDGKEVSGDKETIMELLDQ